MLNILRSGAFRAVTLLVVVLVSSACDTDTDEAEPRSTDPPTAGESSPPSTPSPSGTAIFQASCTNEQRGYAVGYPEDWWVNSGEMAGPCSFFDPERKELEEGTEAPPTAITIKVNQAPYDSIVENARESGKVIAMGPAEVAGGSATTMESESTGRGLQPAGTLTYAYFVDLGERTLVATTSRRPDQTDDEMDYERNKKILDDMMTTLERV